MISWHILFWNKLLVAHDRCYRYIFTKILIFFILQYLAAKMMPINNNDADFSIHFSYNSFLSKLIHLSLYIVYKNKTNLWTTSVVAVTVKRFPTADGKCRRAECSSDKLRCSAITASDFRGNFNSIRNIVVARARVKTKVGI